MMKWISMLLAVIGVCAVLAHAAHVSRPHVRFSTTFSSGEELQIVWHPSENLGGRLLGRGQLVCTVGDSAPIDLVYGRYSVYHRTRFEKQDTIAWDEKDENKIPAYSITETTRGALWAIDHTGKFLGSN